MCCAGGFTVYLSRLVINSNVFQEINCTVNVDQRKQPLFQGGQWVIYHLFLCCPVPWLGPRIITALQLDRGAASPQSAMWYIMHMMSCSVWYASSVVGYKICSSIGGVIWLGKPLRHFEGDRSCCFHNLQWWMTTLTLNDSSQEIDPTQNVPLLNHKLSCQHFCMR